MSEVPSVPAAPRHRLGTPVDGVTVLGSLSPSRTGDFRACPLLYRLRTIDRLPETTSTDAVRGTVVHKVLEDLFDLPAAERTPDHAEGMVAQAWQHLLEERPETSDLFGEEDGQDLVQWLDSCRTVLSRYFDLEDPRHVEPAEREVYVESLLDSKLLLRGFIDRIDVAPDGAIRVVDYKTGRAPGVGYESQALFQLRFYALVIWRSRGVVPRLLQLVYLGSGEVIGYEPDEQDLLATERMVQAVWEAIEIARETGEWLPSRGFACRWCSFQALCPEFGGVTPPLPSAEDSPAATVATG